MAIVRMSTEFRESIIGNAKAIFEARLRAAEKAVPQVGDEIAELVYAELTPALKLVDNRFLSFFRDMELNKIGDTSYGIRYSLNTARPKPNDKIVTANGCIITSNFVTSVTVPLDQRFVGIKDQLDNYKANIAAIQKQRDEFVDGVKKIINAHATLAPALKAWPPLWDLVSETYRERHRKVVERSKPDLVPEVDVDLTALTATVAVNKILK